MAQKLPKLRFNRKIKALIAFAIIAILLFSFFAFVPGQSSSLANWFSKIGIGQGSVRNSGVIKVGQSVNSTVWFGVAGNAWAYFQPGVGVDANTGLPYAGGSYFKALTDWDLGVYIQAVIDAQEIGLIGTNGGWGSYARLNKVLNYLENRQLNETTNYPFWFYDATDGKNYHALSDNAAGSVDVVDTGRLFVALNNLKEYNPAWNQRIDAFVYNADGNRSDYAALVPGLESIANSNDIYGYYFESGYASFWPQQLGNIPTSIINNISKSSKVITYGNVSLPQTPLACEPLLCSIFEVNSTNSELMGIANQVYFAHEAYYNTKGQYVAFSEGNGFSGQYLWEWVVGPNGTPWEITTSGGAHIRAMQSYTVK